MLTPLVVGWAALTSGLDATVPLRGTVVGPHEEPVAGALVLLSGLPAGTPGLARGKTDDRGRVTLDRPARLVGEGRYRAFRVWAARPGLHAAFVALPGELPKADALVTLKLGSPARLEVRVAYPQGGLVAKARVRAERLRRDGLEVPGPIAELTEATTSEDGIARLDAFTGLELTSIEVRAEGYGVQPRTFELSPDGPWVVTLRPVGVLKVEFVTDDPNDLKGWRVWASTRPDEPAGYAPPTGTAFSTLDDQGRCSFPALAAGALSLYVRWPDGGRVLPVWPKLPPVRAGQITSAEVSVKRAATVAGVVRERGTGKPVAGVNLNLYRPGENSGDAEKTDAEGKFAILSPAGKARLWISEVPDAYVRPAKNEVDNIAVPAPPGKVELPPIELTKAAPPLEGEVRDEKGQPVPRADVKTYWNYTEDGKTAGINSILTADDAGHFVLKGLAPGSSVTLEARRHDHASDAPVKAVAGQDRPVTIVIRPADVVALTGRVLGPGGMPVVGAVVTFLYHQNKNGAMSNFQQVAAFDDGVEIRTGPDGTYRTPKELLRESAEFRAQVRAFGLLPGQTPEIPSSDATGDVVRLPDVTLRRVENLSAVSGRVVDRGGATLEGVRVFQSGDGPKRTETRTDAQGRFALEGVYEGPAVVFAEKAGYRFGGAVVRPEARGAAEIRLGRAGEPPLSTLKTLAPTMTRAQERELARRLLDPVIELTRAGANLGLQGTSLYTILARIDPERVLTMVENRVLSVQGGPIRKAALAQFEDDPGAAVATIEADLEPSARAEGFLALADLAVDLDGNRNRRNGFLDRALAETRCETEPSDKVRHLGEIADRWLESGELDHTTPILREGQALLATVQKNGSFFESEPFAEVLGVIDLPAAEAIFERKGSANVSKPTPQDIGRHHGEVAWRIAPYDPAAAERLITGLDAQVYNRQALLLRTCRALAPKDLPRARKLLDLLPTYVNFGQTVSPSLHAYGLALMAGSLAVTDQATARTLLDESIDELMKAAVDDARRGGYPLPSCVLAGLLPLVERLEPDRVGELMWRAVSFRPPRVEPAGYPIIGPDRQVVRSLAVLAMLVDRYDRALADAVFAPVAARINELAAEPNSWGLNLADVFKLIAAHDPRAVASLIDRLPESARKTRVHADRNWVETSLDVQARVALAELLGLPVETRRRAALGTTYQPWPVIGSGRPGRE